MKSKLKALLDDDSGVSPVIGVILMVAITVILAAVIGTFVLGLGDSLNQAPQSQMDVEANDTAVEISHNGGDSIASDDIRVMAGGTEHLNDSGTNSFSVSGTPDEFSVGNTLTFDHSLDAGDVQVQVIHQPSESVLLDTEVTIPSSA